MEQNLELGRIRVRCKTLHNIFGECKSKIKETLRLMGTKRIVYEDKQKQQVAAEWLLAWIVSNGSLLRADLTDEYTSWWNSRMTPLDAGISDVLLGVI